MNPPVEAPESNDSVFGAKIICNETIKLTKKLIEIIEYILCSKIGEVRQWFVLEKDMAYIYRIMLLVGTHFYFF